MKPGTPLQLADRLELHSVEIPEMDSALRRALQGRGDYRSLASQRESLVEQQKSNRARYFPKFSVNGDYGVLGRNLGDLPGTGLIQGTVSVALFDRDRTGEQQELQSRVQRLDAQIADLERGIERELRKAVLDLESAEQQVKVTETGLDLAERELALARDRFRNGLTDNLEVVTAQTSLQAAQDDRIVALGRHTDAAMALARALGATEQNYLKYVAGQ
jgi:outer membrane protein TolC